MQLFGFVETVTSSHSSAFIKFITYYNYVMNSHITIPKLALFCVGVGSSRNIVSMDS